MRLLPRRAVLSAGLVAATTALARASPRADAVLDRIAAARSTVRTLRGPFTQTRTIALLATDVRSHGLLTLVRPDRMRWELDRPDDITFWLGPEGISFRGSHGGGRLPPSQVRVGEALDDLRNLLGGDISHIQQRWQVTVIRDDSSGAELEAVPRVGTVTSIRRVRLALAADLIRPTKVRVYEGEYDQTVVEFGSLVVNAPVADAEMAPSGSP